MYAHTSRNVKAKDANTDIDGQFYDLSRLCCGWRVGKT